MVLSSKHLLLVLVATPGLLVVTEAAEVTCYAPDGITIAPNDSYVPCNKLGITQQGVFSSCCLLDGDPTSRDLCAQSGLCLRGGIVQREYCTDKEWKSPACVPVCIDAKAGGSANGTAELTPCTDGTFCCGKNNLTCCGTSYAVSVKTLASVVVVQTATVTPDSAGATSIAAIAGLAGGLGVVILAAAGVVICLRRKNATLKRDNARLTNALAQSDPSLPPSAPRPTSFMPGSGAPTLTAPSSHVPSMQDFAAFKAFMGYQAATDAFPVNPRYSELDGTAAAAARRLSRLSMQPPPPPPPTVGVEPLHEDDEMQRILFPPVGSAPNMPLRGPRGGMSPD